MWPATRDVFLESLRCLNKQTFADAGDLVTPFQIPDLKLTPPPLHSAFICPLFSYIIERGDTTRLHSAHRSQATHCSPQRRSPICSRFTFRLNNMFLSLYMPAYNIPSTSTGRAQPTTSMGQPIPIAVHTSHEPSSFGLLVLRILFFFSACFLY